MVGQGDSVDSTIIEAWAFMKSIKPKEGSGEPPGPGSSRDSDFHCERRANATHH